MKTQWPEVELSEALVHRKERPSESDLALGKIRLVSKISFANGQIDFRAGIETKTGMILIQPGDLLISGINAYKGAIAIYKDAEGLPAAATIHYASYSVREDRADCQFLWYLLRSELFRTRLAASVPGGIKTELKPTRLLPIRIPLPPLEEQRRITSRLEATRVRVAEALAIASHASLLIDALIASEEMRMWSELVGIPVRRLDEVTNFLSRGRQSQQGDSEHYLIKTQHVQMGRCLPTPLTLAEGAAARVKPDALVRTGDVLIACSAAGCLGRVAQFTESGKTASTDTHVAIARPDSTLIDPEYLYCYLRSAPGQFQLRSRERGDWMREKVGFRLTELNLNDLRAVPVPVPSFPEQKRIVGMLGVLHEKASALKVLQSESSAQLAALIPSTLDKALNGHL